MSIATASARPPLVGLLSARQVILLAGRRAQRHNATINIAKNLGRVPQSDGQVFAQIRVFAVVEGWKGSS